VLGAEGDLKGYALGVHRKRWLLDHETAIESSRVRAQMELVL
jgi:methylated-DNA-[protein]-cysteine S-methyltransferase